MYYLYVVGMCRDDIDIVFLSGVNEQVYFIFLFKNRYHLNTDFYVTYTFTFINVKREIMRLCMYGIGMQICGSTILMIIILSYI